MDASLQRKQIQALETIYLPREPVKQLYVSQAYSWFPFFENALPDLEIPPGRRSKEAASHRYRPAAGDYDLPRIGLEHQGRDTFRVGCRRLLHPGGCGRAQCELAKVAVQSASVTTPIVVSILRIG